MRGEGERGKGWREGIQDLPIGGSHKRGGSINFPRNIS